MAIPRKLVGDARGEANDRTAFGVTGSSHVWEKLMLNKFVCGLSVACLIGCGPSSYEDCLLQNLKDQKNEEAVAVIHQACILKFDKSQPKAKTRELTETERSRLTGRAGLKYSSGDEYEVTLYNGNENLTIDTVKIAIAIPNAGSESFYEYNVNIYIAPLSTSTKSFPIVIGDKRGKYSWVIVGATGFAK